MRRPTNTVRHLAIQWKRRAIPEPRARAVCRRVGTNVATRFAHAYVWRAEGWSFVAVVLDLYPRRVTRWQMQPTISVQLAIHALPMAIFGRGGSKTVMYRCEGGSRYTSEDFQRLVDSHGINCGMSRRRNCWNNAAMKSFFSTLKLEQLRRKQ